MSNDIYKQHILDHYNNPRNKSMMFEPDIEQVAKNPSCGDSYILYLKIENEAISDVTFSGVGCAISTAAASLLTEKIKGTTVDGAKKITKNDIFELLKVDISIGREKCALLVFNALHDALNTLENKV